MHSVDHWQARRLPRRSLARATARRLPCGCHGLLGGRVRLVAPGGTPLRLPLSPASRTSSPAAQPVIGRCLVVRSAATACRASLGIRRSTSGGPGIVVPPPTRPTARRHVSMDARVRYCGV